MTFLRARNASPRIRHRHVGPATSQEGKLPALLTENTRRCAIRQSVHPPRTGGVQCISDPTPRVSLPSSDGTIPINRPKYRHRDGCAGMKSFLEPSPGSSWKCIKDLQISSQSPTPNNQHTHHTTNLTHHFTTFHPSTNMPSFAQLIDMTYCTLCDHYFPGNDARAQHVQLSTNHPRCETCDKRFPNGNSLRNVSPHSLTLHSHVLT